MNKRVLLALVALAAAFSLWVFHNKGRKDECNNCREWVKTQKGFFLTDPCQSICDE